MIKYRLSCNKGHEFEGWFRSGAAFDEQASQHQISCLSCGSTDVSKAVMAPRINAKSSTDADPKELLNRMRDLREKVTANSEYVGPHFAEEARKIHHEESSPRGIYGEATAQEAIDLHEDGIAVFPLPRLPEDQN